MKKNNKRIMIYIITLFIFISFSNSMIANDISTLLNHKVIYLRCYIVGKLDNNTYEIIPNNFGENRALLKTILIDYSSEGWTNILVKKSGVQNVQLKNGFSETWDIYTQLTPQDIKIYDQVLNDIHNVKHNKDFKIIGPISIIESPSYNNKNEFYYGGVIKNTSNKVLDAVNVVFTVYKSKNKEEVLTTLKSGAFLISPGEYANLEPATYIYTDKFSKEDFQYFDIELVYPVKNEYKKDEQIEKEKPKNNKYGTSSLISAILNNDLKQLKEIINSDNINKRFKNGFTLLMIASKECKNSEVIRFLLNEGADPTLTDNDGKTALYYIKNNISLKDSNAFYALKGAIQLHKE
ncbi:MAG: ankyrin repeat domain-containing protein [bacterium]